MQSKEKIEKAKEDFSFFYEGDYITKEMVGSKEIIFEYIEQLERTIKTISEEQTHKQDDYCRHYCNINIEHKYLISEKQKLIEKLEEDLKEHIDSIQDQYNLYEDYYSRTGGYPNQMKQDVAKLSGEKNKIFEILKNLKGEKYGYNRNI